jgi:hypothetical protein
MAKLLYVQLYRKFGIGVIQDLELAQKLEQEIREEQARHQARKNAIYGKYRGAMSWVDDSVGFRFTEAGE